MNSSISCVLVAFDHDFNFAFCNPESKKDVAVDIVNHLSGMMNATLSKTSMNYA